jgi:SNF2 family DNA or RNA helicase
MNETDFLSCRDYRQLKHIETSCTLSDRILNPVVSIARQNKKYRISLGANVTKGENTVFISCPSVHHNWLLDSKLIRPLPFDAPSVLRSALTDVDPEDVRFPAVLSLVRKGIEGIDVIVAPEVFERANDSSIKMSLEQDLAKLNATLYPYQQHGVAWMHNALHSIGGLILADEMGLGKTLQIIALILLDEPSNETPALIICPTTLIANWCREIMKFSPALTLMVHRGAARTGDFRSLMRSQVVITTYDTLVNDRSMFMGVKWKYLICDEAQAVKNPEAKRRVVLAEIHRDYTIPVTGTPMENTLMDLWSLADLAVPGLLGDRESFSSTYPDTDAGAANLAKVLDAIILKRQVKDVANDLPERTDIDLPIEFSESEIEVYKQIREEAIAEYGRAGRLVAINRLSIYCAHPWLRAKDVKSIDWEETVQLDDEPAEPLFTPKMEVCIRILKEAFITNKKVLIFAVYNCCGKLIKLAARERGLPTGYWNEINGSTPQQDRQTFIDEFSAHRGPAVLILNPKAAGAGLNITAATVVIHYTQNWNPALELQASARAHRRGQKSPVTVYRLYYQDTVEKTMLDRSLWKRNLGDSAVPLSTRDNDDLDTALSITPAL